MAKESREIQTLRKNQEKMLEIKNTVTEMKIYFDRVISILLQPRRESVSLNIGKQKLSELNYQNKKE